MPTNQQEVSNAISNVQGEIMKPSSVKPILPIGFGDNNAIPIVSAHKAPDPVQMDTTNLRSIAE